MIWMLIFLALWLALGLFGFWSEAREWNGGMCRQCGKKWWRFDTDSQGGRGYKCDRLHYLWLSWPVEKGGKS